MANVYKDEEFSHLRQEPRMAEIARPPSARKRMHLRADGLGATQAAGVCFLEMT